jgi:hypothetical protein
MPEWYVLIGLFLLAVVALWYLLSSYAIWRDIQDYKEEWRRIREDDG